MPSIKKIKAQSPDPYLGKIKGDTELARLAHLNNLVDQVNEALGAIGPEGITVNGVSNITSVNIEPTSSQYYDGTSLNITIDPYPNKRVYRAKIATESVAWPGYGYLYNWYAVDDARGLANPDGGTGLTAPNEWRVPSVTDWTTLETFLGGPALAGEKLKSVLTSTAYPFYGWIGGGSGTDDYNFGALGGGIRFEDAVFTNIGLYGTYWLSTSISGSNANFFYTAFNNDAASYGDTDKRYGLSVRLVREATAGELLLADGDTSDTSSLDPYTGNDGKTYVTTKIGTQIWLAQNLRELKYNDNSDITNRGQSIGGDGSNTAWINAGIANEGAVTSYLYNGESIPYNPNTIIEFYNDVLENTFSENLIWVGTTLGFGPIYALTIPSRPWNKTHIKVTPAWTNDDSLSFPNNLLTENSLIIQNADAGVYSINFFPFKRSVAGVATSEHLNNYRPDGSNKSYVYLEIIEYVPDTPYYYSGVSGLGISNLEEEITVFALGEVVEEGYQEDPEVTRLSEIYIKIYKILGIELNPTSV